MAITAGFAGKIPVEERVEECEYGVSTHHEVRDMKKQKHELDFTCFPKPQPYTLDTLVERQLNEHP